MTLSEFFLTFGLLLLSLTQTARAIEIDRPFIAESWTLAPGSVFELLAVPSTDLQYTWSLTRADGTFMQADRGPLFRERFVESGDYALKAEATAANLAPFTNRTFVIHVVPGAPPVATGSSVGSLVTTDVPVDGNGVIVLSEERKTLLFTGVAGSSQLSLDFDASKDANGDGDPTNDADSRGTFFESDGSPLRIWLTDAPADRTITVRGVSAAGPQTQTLRIASFSTPPPSSATPPLLAPTELEVIQIEDRGGGTFAFSVKEGSVSAEGRALLFLWDFGDGRQSMLDHPVHTYAANGQYAVSLRARDLTTTQEVFAVTGTLPVNTIVAPASSGASSSSVTSQQYSVSSQSSSGAQPASSGMWKLIITIVVVLLLAVLVGFGIVTLLGRVVRRKLDTPLESAPKAKAPPKKSSPTPSLDQAPPMPVIDVAPMAGTPPKPATPASTKSILEPSKIETLSFQEEQAPSWLRQGHEEAKKRGLSVTSAAPPQSISTDVAPQPAAPSLAVRSSEEAKEAPAPSPSVTPTAPVEPEPPAETEERTLPPWLTEVPPEEEVPASAPTEPRAVPAPAPSESSPPPPPSTPPQSVSTDVAPPLPSPPPAPPTLEPSKPAPTKPPITPPPALVKPAEQKPAMTTPAPSATPVQETKPPADEESEEEEKGELTPAERERRRKKRARYRANKRQRESSSAEATGDKTADREETIQGSTPQEKHPSAEITPQPTAVTPEPPTPKQKSEPPAPEKSNMPPPPVTSTAGKQENQKPKTNNEQLSASAEQDAPIAIIRAENLGKEQKNPKKS